MKLGPFNFIMQWFLWNYKGLGQYNNISLLIYILKIHKIDDQL